MAAASAGPGGVALWRSGGPGIFAFHGEARLKNGALVPDASGELDAKIQ